jgi:hypothetical protein
MPRAIVIDILIALCSDINAMKLAILAPPKATVPFGLRSATLPATSVFTVTFGRNALVLQAGGAGGFSGMSIGLRPSARSARHRNSLLPLAVLWGKWGAGLCPKCLSSGTRDQVHFRRTTAPLPIRTSDGRHRAPLTSVRTSGRRRPRFPIPSSPEFQTG